jgi:flagella basal body P-ring formation protein FlgA
MIHDLLHNWLPEAMKRFKTHSAATFGSASCVVVALLVNSAIAADIALNASAAPQGSVVRLGDVAEITADNTKEAERLAAVPLMPAPAPGTERFIRMREVQDLLAAHGENMDQLRFKGELLVQVTSPERIESATTQATNSDMQSARHAAWTSGSSSAVAAAAATDSDPSQVREELNRQLVDYLNRASGQTVAWHVTFNIPGQQLASLPADPTTWKITGGAAPWTGKQRLLVSFPAGQHSDSFTVPADVTVPTPTVIAIRPIDRGSVVTAADVEIQQRDATPAIAGRALPLTSIDKLLGMEATRSIQIGDIVMSDSVQPPVLVKRGDSVTVYARGGGIQVKTIARAKENGSLGQPVQLESLETHKTYDAVITGTREAIVLASSGPQVTAASNDHSGVFRR